MPKRRINYRAVNSKLFSELKNTTEPIARRKLEGRIVAINEKLVYRAAHRWVNYKNVPLSLDELYSIGLGGLLTALRNFDSTYGVQFSTFATNHINGAIKRTIRDKGSLIKIPQSLQGKGKGKVNVGDIRYVSIDNDERTLNLVREYDELKLQENQEKVERWLALFRTAHLTPSVTRQSFIEGVNRLIDTGVLDRERIGGSSRVIDGVEYLQVSLW